MPVKKHKDLSNLIGKMRLKCKSKYYFDVYLWSSLDDLLKNIKMDLRYESVEEWRKSRACCVFNPSYLINGKEKIYPKLGEVHFIKDKWLMVDVAHELCHALMRRIDLWPLKKGIHKPTGARFLLSNEDIAYEFGDWVHEVYGWLWKINPYNKRWKRL